MNPRIPESGELNDDAREPRHEFRTPAAMWYRGFGVVLICGAGLAGALLSLLFLLTGVGWIPTASIIGVLFGVAAGLGMAAALVLTARYRFRSIMPHGDHLVFQGWMVRRTIPCADIVLLRKESSLSRQWSHLARLVIRSNGHGFVSIWLLRPDADSCFHEACVRSPQAVGIDLDGTIHWPIDEALHGEAARRVSTLHGREGLLQMMITCVATVVLILMAVDYQLQMTTFSQSPGYWLFALSMVLVACSQGWSGWKKIRWSRSFLREHQLL